MQCWRSSILRRLRDVLVAANLPSDSARFIRNVPASKSTLLQRSASISRRKRRTPARTRRWIAGRPPHHRLRGPPPPAAPTGGACAPASTPDEVPATDLAQARQHKQPSYDKQPVHMHLLYCPASSAECSRPPTKHKDGDAHGFSGWHHAGGKGCST
jgi:hypothetical protein